MLALTNVRLASVRKLADHRLPFALEQDAYLRFELNFKDGRVTCRAVADAQGLDARTPSTFDGSIELHRRSRKTLYARPDPAFKRNPP